MKKNYWNLTDKSQTKIKLNILRNYLNVWSRIFANRTWCQEMYFVDCFAGRGKYHDKGQKNIIDGSPLIALKTAQVIKKKYNRKVICFFIEKEPSVFKELQGFVGPFKSEINFQTIRGDINKEIDQVLNKIPDNWNKPILFFIDPSGIDIRSDSIKKMLNRSNIKEFLITYIQKGVERSLGFGKKASTDLPIEIRKMALGNLKRIEDFFGVGWKELSKDQRENIKKYLNVFIEYNKKASPYNQLKFRKIEVLYNQGRNKYHLIFISRNKNALEIMEDIFTSSELRNTLFAGLSLSEKRKILRGSFNV